jgi:hypothetical protein
MECARSPMRGRRFATCCRRNSTPRSLPLNLARGIERGAPAPRLGDQVEGRQGCRHRPAPSFWILGADHSSLSSPRSLPQVPRAGDPRGTTASRQLPATTKSHGREHMRPICCLVMAFLAPFRSYATHRLGSTENITDDLEVGVEPHRQDRVMYFRSW